MPRMRLVTFLAATLAASSGCVNAVRSAEDFSFTHRWQDYRAVHVKVRNGSVEVRAGQVQDIRISGNRYASGATLREAQENVDRLEVFVGPSEGDTGTFVVELRYPEELKHRNIGANVLVEVPQPVASDVRTSNGAIKVSRLAGDVRLDTSNGSVDARDIDGALTVETSNGNVVIQDVSGKVVAVTSNGGVQALNLRSACKLVSSNGDIRLTADPLAGSDIELRTSNANIHATLPQTIAAELEANTSNGRVQVDLPEATMQKVSAGKSAYQATLNGGGAKLIADTSNGSITIDAR